MLLMLSVFVSSILSHAASSDDCVKALGEADKLIQLQDALIMKLSKVVETKQNQDEELTKALVKMKELSDVQFHTNIAVGAVGVVVGVLIMAYVRR